MTPSGGPLAGGTVITLTGRGFAVPTMGEAPVVTVGSQPCAVASTHDWSPTRIVCTTAPAEAEGPTAVVVLNSVTGESVAHPRCS